jgi:cyclopropane fatty-acyl-phospholipid synthase-like methyltransferase
MDTRPADIKSMKLYTQVERVFNELRAMGIPEDAPLEATTISAFDQYHYLGTETVDEAIRVLGLGRESRVLDLGAGIGGPARHLAAVARCRVTAIELQPDLDETARALTKRCGLDRLVDHVNGDFMAWSPHEPGFDAVVSWLVFLHLPDRPEAVARMRRILRPGGMVYIEDFFEKGRLTPAEWADLRREVWAKDLPSMAEWVAQFEAAGFHDVRPIDMTPRWAPFVKDRFAKFRAARERNLRVHGAHVTDALDTFYETIDRLFKGGNLGGIRMIARAPGR